MLLCFVALRSVACGVVPVCALYMCSRCSGCSIGTLTHMAAILTHISVLGHMLSVPVL